MDKVALVIDDDALFRQQVSDLLAGMGYRVVGAATGREGLNSFVASSPEIVLLDLVLPDLSGFEILERFAARGQAGRVIVTTSDFSLDSALRTLRAGAGDYLPKPLRAEALHTSVERVSRRLRMQEENQRLQQQLRQRVSDLKIMRHISQQVTSARRLEEWSQEVTETICGYLGAEAGSLLLLTEDGQELEFFTATGPAGSQARCLSLPRSQGGVAWACLEQGTPVKVDRVSDDPRFNQQVDRRTGFTTRNILAVPIVVGKRPVGVIELLNKKGAACFGQEDLNRLQEVAATMAVAVQNALVARDLLRSREELARWSRELESKVAERTRELEQANQEKQKAYDELLQSHQRLRQAQATLLEREKVAALGLLGAGVAHEINNPLGFVRANIETLQQYVRALRRLTAVLVHAGRRAESGRAQNVLPLVEEARRIIEEEHLAEAIEDMGPLFEEIADGITRIGAIVEQLRVFAEEGSPRGNPEPCNLEAELRRTALLAGAACRVEGEACAEVSCRIAPLPTLHMPLGSLRQVLLGMLGAQTRKHGPGPKSLRAWEEGGMVFVEVRDAGSDLTDDEVLRLFDPFYLPGGGQQHCAGLGLSAAYGLARSLGGRLSARRDEEGLAILLELPAAQNQQQSLEEVS